MSIGTILTHNKTKELLQELNFQVVKESPLPKFYLSKKTQKEKKEEEPKYWFMLRKPQELNLLKDPSIPQIQDIVVSDLIGAGNFGQVFKGMWNGTPVACMYLLHVLLSCFI